MVLEQDALQFRLGDFVFGHALDYRRRSEGATFGRHGPSENAVAFRQQTPIRIPKDRTLFGRFTAAGRGR